MNHLYLFHGDLDLLRDRLTPWPLNLVNQKRPVQKWTGRFPLP